ncbi:MAG: hypothetical protein P8Z31_05030 [Gammaproteobacteria bacterium]|jgi:hypothetical protein
MGKKDIQQMSAEELYALAQKKEKEEEAVQKEKAKAELAKLRDERKELIAKHKKKLAALDAQIRAMGGRTGGASKGRQTGASATILKLLADGEMDTKSIRSRLESMGISVSNLGQTMAYLKRNGKVKSAARGVYKLA